LLLSLFQDKESKEPASRKNRRKFFKLLYVLSFACAKERTKEKHTGNDIQPLPDTLI